MAVTFSKLSKDNTDQVPAASALTCSAGDTLGLNATGQAVKANATSGATTRYPAVGLSLLAVTSGKDAVGNDQVTFVHGEGAIAHGLTGATGLTPGGEVYLSTTAGGRTQTAPTVTSQLRQQIGTARDSDSMFVTILTAERVGGSDAT